VFEIIDTHVKDSSTQLVIKFSENYKVLTQEIRTISRMRKAFKKRNNQGYPGYPSMKSYGMIVMENS